MKRQQRLTQSKYYTKKSTLIVIIAMLFGVILAVGIITSLFKNDSMKMNAVISNVTSSNKASYANEFWGFGAEYPKDWHMYEAPSGMNYFFNSYSGDAEKDTWYLPKKNELQINVEIRFEEDAKDVQWEKVKGFIKKEQGSLIDGKESIIVYRKANLSNYESGRNNNNNTSQYTIDQGRYTKTYIVTNNSITYLISADPADSELIKHFDEFIANFTFTQRREYKQASITPSEGNVVYQNTEVGFLFEHPENMTCDDDTYGICFLKSRNPNSALDPYIKVETVDNLYNDYNTFEENIINYASLSCTADGPGGSMYCPIEDMNVQTFDNARGAKGYLLERKRIHARYTDTGEKYIVDSKNETVIFYELDAPHRFAVMFSLDMNSFDNSDLDNALLEIAHSFDYLELHL